MIAGKGVNSRNNIEVYMLKDEELEALRVKLSQAVIDIGGKNDYIKALKQQVKELKERVAELEGNV